MHIEKIKQVKHDFHEKIGPSKTITLGFKAGDHTFILGSFYIGPCMNEGDGEKCMELESMIDEIVKMSNHWGDSEGGESE